MKDELELIALRKQLEDNKTLFQEYFHKGDMVRMNLFKQKMDQIAIRINDIESVIKGMEQYRQNKHLTNWVGKTLTSVVTLADITTHYVMNSQNFFKEHGMTPKADLQTAIDNYNAATAQLRAAYNKFLDNEIRAMSNHNFENLEALIAKELFTDREMVYYEKYSR